MKGRSIVFTDIKIHTEPGKQIPIMVCAFQIFFCQLQMIVRVCGLNAGGYRDLRIAVIRQRKITATDSFLVLEVLICPKRGNRFIPDVVVSPGNVGVSCYINP